MQELQFKYVSKDWDGSKSRYSVQQLEKAVTKAMLRFARRIAKDKGREIVKDDLHCHFREPNGDININGITSALGRLNQIKNPTPTDAEIASARAELEEQRTKARKALGLDKKSKLMAESIGDIGFSMIEDLMESEAWTPVPEVEPYFAPEPAMMDPQAAPAMGHGIPGGSLGSALDTGYQTAVLDGGIQTYDSPSSGFPNPALFNPALAAHAHAALAAAPAPAPVSLTNAEFVELAAGPVKLTNADGIAGVVDNDYRPLPNWRALGIDRPAGNATQQELADLQGAMRADGSPLRPEDVLSVGAMICNIDRIEQFGFYLPPIELARLGMIAATRPIKSDQDHSRQVMSGNFTVAPSSVRIGTDPGSTLHVDHPLLGKVPYTGLMGRLLFQRIPSDEAQMAAIDAVLAGKIENLSIAFGFGGVTCALCGEVPVERAIKENGYVLGFVIDPGSHEHLCAMSPDDFASSWDSVMGTLRTPADTFGDYAYRTVRLTGCTMDGTVTIEPIPEATFDLARGTVFMFDMASYGFFYGGGRRYCRFHGSAGSYYRDGRKTCGAVTNSKSFINVAECDKGAVEARICLQP